jgi:hypothetical protein
MFKKISPFTTILFLFINTLHAQTATSGDTVRVGKNRFLVNDEMYYSLKNGSTLIYSKPKKFGFVTNLPKDAAGIVSSTFRKESIKPLLVIAASTAGLILIDQNITDEFRKFADRINFSPDEKNKNLLNFKMGDKDVSLLRLPTNANTAIYQLGQGFPSLVIGAGLFAYGKIHNDFRALSTASQLAESFILMGVGTQIVKRITGRQSPSEATSPAGEWNFLPSFSDYQNRTPYYDAFPSGHLATLMSSVTIFSKNYPEKKWIKPVGYSVTGLVALSMINNKVHWASDYPLALGMGYICARQVVNRNRRISNGTSSKKHKGNLDYTVNYHAGTITPGIIYTF